MDGADAGGAVPSELVDVDGEAREKEREAPPSPGEDARADGGEQGQAFQDVQQDVVGEQAQPVLFFPVAVELNFLGRHFSDI